jgi:hypothetical protein
MVPIAVRGQRFHTPGDDTTEASRGQNDTISAESGQCFSVDKITISSRRFAEKLTSHLLLSIDISAIFCYAYSCTQNQEDLKIDVKFYIFRPHFG